MSTNSHQSHQNQADHTHPVDPFDAVSVTTLRRFLEAKGIRKPTCSSWSTWDDLWAELALLRAEIAEFASTNLSN